MPPTVPPEPLPIAVILADRELDGYADRYTDECMASFSHLQQALESLPGYTFQWFSRHRTLWQDLAAAAPVLALNACDDGFMNRIEQELHIPALLEILNIPYSGAGPGCLALCYHKGHVSAIARSRGIPVPDEITVALDPLREGAAWTGQTAVPYPAVVKPLCADGSFGISDASLVYSDRDAARALQELAGLLPAGEDALLQRFLPGHEYNVAVLGNSGMLEILPILEMNYSALPGGAVPLLTAAAKWDPQSAHWNDVIYRAGTPDAAATTVMTDAARELFSALGCRDYARFDFRLDANGVPRLIDVNPNPSWEPDGNLAMMAGLAGYTYPQLLARILDAARQRQGLQEAAHA